jgi:hypothetical protein
MEILTLTVFCGPTLRRAEIEAILPDADVLGPVAFGDVIRACDGGARAVIILDGYFDRRPAVWHKEILWAMSEGVHVFGASSMGALRAAELADFGMEGDGAIFAAFRSGEIEADDEVAVVHGPEEEGYRPLSEALVNLRATFQAARDRGVISETVCCELVRVARDTFYSDRAYPLIFDQLALGDKVGEEVERLRAWLPTGRVDLKRGDALHLLERVRQWRMTSPTRKVVDYRFEPTDAWHEALRSAREGATTTDINVRDGFEGILEEIRIRGKYLESCNGAVARAAAQEAARAAAVTPDAATIRAAVVAIRQRLDLADRAAFSRWRAEQGLSDDDEFTQFFIEAARVHWAAPLIDQRVRDYVCNHLREQGEYGAIASRAKAKRAQLLASGYSTPTLADFGLDEQSLWQWYFSQCLGRPTPSDLSGFSRANGFADLNEFRLAVLREYAFSKSSAQGVLEATRVERASFLSPK